MNTIIANSFSAIFIFGNNVFKEQLLKILKIPKKQILVNDYFNEYYFNIITVGCIDFIIIDINIIEHVADIINLKSVIKKFIKNKKYLISNIIYFTKYINPCQSQILYYLALYEINIQLVTLKPNISFDEYIDVCKKLNLTTFIIKDIKFTKEEFLKIIKNIYDYKYDEIYNIFIELI